MLLTEYIPFRVSYHSLTSDKIRFQFDTRWLGYLSHPDFPPDKVSARITNTLPEMFRAGEEESMAIIWKTRFAQAAEQVDYIFI